mmetsp:Transcript_12841/g.39625  ORF Transcript_12841/g.39625 Transcript_12841/m.39625 type:complete len:329 (-) Transcript_12841:36-1022(-)
MCRSGSTTLVEYADSTSIRCAPDDSSPGRGTRSTGSSRTTCTTAAGTKKPVGFPRCLEIRSPDRAGLVAPTPRGGRARRGVLATRRGAASGPFLAASRESASSAVAATSPRRRRAFPGLSRRLARGQVFAADLAASLPGFNYSALPGEKFDAWLKRLPLVEGLAFELFLRMNRPDVAAYIKRTDPIHFPANLGELLQASGGERIGPDAAPSSASRVSVCLEDFMSDPARTHRTWRNVLQAVAPGAVPDAALEQCIADHDTTASQATFLNNTRSKAHPHGTYRTVSPTELDGMLKMARGLDAGFLGGTYAAAAQRIGCNTTRAARRRFV